LFGVGMFSSVPISLFGVGMFSSEPISLFGVGMFLTQLISLLAVALYSFIQTLNYSNQNCLVNEPNKF
jgi:hypothetical protein